MNARHLLGATLAIALVGFVACQDEPYPTEPEAPQVATPLFEATSPTDLPENVAPDPLPEATVAPLDFARTLSTENATAGTITPDAVTAVLQAGESISEEKTVTVAAGLFPTVADILFAFDLTGSMGGELANAKVNSTNIMNAIRTEIPDSWFGVVSHMDYDGSYSGCGYSGTYGYYPPDYPYSLDLSLTGDVSAASAAINGLALGYGEYYPENYTRVLYEAANDAGIGWRSDGARFLVYWQDALPHSCDVSLGGECYGSSFSYGPDPGRDAVLGTGDELELGPALQGLADMDINLVALHSGGSFSLDIWDCYAEKTGGDAFMINYDGTVPGGTDIADFIVDKIEEVFNQVDVLELEASASFESWLNSTTTFGPINLGDGGEFTFPIEIMVPSGTEPGIYNFQVCVVADGVTLNLCQDVMIVVYDPSGGFVTGGGWIYSDAGAYLPDPTLEGKANFGFVSKYKKGATTPDGNTEFQFHAADLNFHSESYEWLIVTGQGDYAMFKGTGTVNGEFCTNGPWKFMLWAGDDDPDTFRIRIWCEYDSGYENVLYDNGFAQPIDAGSIVIHKK
jgi:hypothetical protein